MYSLLRFIFPARYLERDLPEASHFITAEDKMKGILPYTLKRAGKIIFKTSSIPPSREWGQDFLLAYLLEVCINCAEQ